MKKKNKYSNQYSDAKHIGIDRETAKPYISSKSISKIMDEVSHRHKKSLDRLAE